MKIVDYLKQHALINGSKIAVKSDEVQFTYSELYQMILQRKESYVQYRGKAVAFRVVQSYEFLVDYFAIHLAGGIAVPLDKNFPDSSFNLLCDELENSFFDSSIADILFTTGTTGASKGVMISHEAIVANAENLIDAQGFHSEQTFIICGPLNHIGSLSKIYPSIIVGSTIHVLNGLKDLNAFFYAIEQSPNSVATFMVPATIRMVLSMDTARLHQNSHKIDFIETGAAPISESDMKKLCEVLPCSKLFNTYASTETGIIATYDYKKYGCIAGCLGKPMKHSSISFTDEGFIICMGKTLMSGYWNDQLLTESVLKNHCIYTKDLGTWDENGNLRLLGRDGDVINIGGYKVSPTEIEDVVLGIKGVLDCVCIPFSHKVLGCTLKLLVKTDKDSKPTFKEIAARLKEVLEPYKVPQFYEYVESINRTFNGKINRKAYK